MVDRIDLAAFERQDRLDSRRAEARQDEQLRRGTEAIQGSDELVASLSGLVAAVGADSAAIKEAERLEVEASRVRNLGKQNLYGALEAAGVSLQELSQSGEVEPHTILEGFVAVYNYSERFHPGWPDLRKGPRGHRKHHPKYYDAKQLLTVFDAMKAGEPIVGHDSAPTGMLVEDPVVEVVSNGLDMQRDHLSIRAALVLPMRLVEKDGLAANVTQEKFAITSSELPFVAGVAAVKAYFEHMTPGETFKEDRCGHDRHRVSNTEDMIKALAQAKVFQEAGLEIDTSNLEAQIEIGTNADEQYRQQRRRRNQQRRARSPFYR